MVEAATHVAESAADLDGRGDRAGRNGRADTDRALPRSTWFVLALFALALLLFTKDRANSWADGSRMGTIQAVVEQGTLALDETDFLWQGDKVTFGGRFYSHQPPMLALLGSAPYGVLHHVLGRGITEPFTYRVITWCVTGLPLLLGLWALAQLLVRAGTPRGWIAPLVALAGFGTLALPYGLVLNQHGTAAGLVLLAFLAVDRKRPVIAGALLSVATTVDLTAVFPAVFCAWPLLKVGGVRAVVRYALGALPALALHLSINRAVAGDLVPFGLHLEAFRYSLSPFLLMALTGGGEGGELAGTQATYAWGALGGRSGLFSHHPWLLLAVAAGIALMRVPAAKRRETIALAPGLLVAAALSALAITAFYVTQSRNFGGSSFGMRWFAVFAPLLALFPGAWLGTRSAGWRPRGALIALVLVTGLWSTGAAALGSVQPWMKFAYFWRHTPAAVLATPETSRPTWGAHLAAEWARVRHWHQPFERDYYVRWYAKILNQHGLVRLKRWSAFTEAEQEAWVRQGLRDLHVVTDEMVKADDRTIARATAHFWLGKFHKRLGEKAQAIVEFNRALGIYPQYTAAVRAKEDLD